MRRRLLGAALLALVLALVGDVCLALFYLPTYWRPLPPFGALTNPRQREWLADQRRVLAGEKEEEPGIGRFDALLGWTNGAGTRSADGSVTIGAGGARGPREYGRRAPPGTLRVAAFGDSFTFCQEVADADAWEAQLEELRPGTEAMNFGVGGYGTDQALLRARRRLPEADADVALLGLLLENVGRNVNRYRPCWYPRASMPAAKPRFVLAGGGIELVPQPFATRAELVAAVADGSVREILRPHEHWADDHVPPLLGWSAVARLWAGRRFYAERDLGRLWSDTGGEPFRVTLALIESFSGLARANGAGRSAVLVFPTEDDLARWSESGERYWTTLLDELARRGLPCIDLSEPLAEARGRAGGPGLFTGAHLSRAGNAVVARRVAAWLDARPRERDGAAGEEAGR